jgi:hypothetical protein
LAEAFQYVPDAPPDEPDCDHPDDPIRHRVFAFEKKEKGAVTPQKRDHNRNPINDSSNQRDHLALLPLRLLRNNLAEGFVEILRRRRDIAYAAALSAVIQGSPSSRGNATQSETRCTRKFILLSGRGPDKSSLKSRWRYRNFLRAKAANYSNHRVD